MRLVKWRVAVLCCSILLIHCSQESSMKFTERWSGDLDKMWAEADEILDYDELEDRKFNVPLYLEDAVGSETVTRKAGFVMLIKGKLPLGTIIVKAIHVSPNGNRETYAISPSKLTIDDPKANLRAIRITNLVSPTVELGQALLHTTHVEPGLYNIFLLKSNKEIASCELLIRPE